LLRLLKSKGGDFTIKNKEDVSIFQIAAQGDQTLSLVYLRDAGYNLNEVDAKGSTALHFAAFLGSENAVNYLTAWGVNLDV